MLIIFQVAREPMNHGPRVNFHQLMVCKCTKLLREIIGTIGDRRNQPIGAVEHGSIHEILKIDDFTPVCGRIA